MLPTWPSYDSFYLILYWPSCPDRRRKCQQGILGFVVFALSDGGGPVPLSLHWLAGQIQRHCRPILGSELDTFQSKQLKTHNESCFFFFWTFLCFCAILASFHECAEKLNIFYQQSHCKLQIRFWACSELNLLMLFPFSSLQLAKLAGSKSAWGSLVVFFSQSQHIPRSIQASSVSSGGLIQLLISSSVYAALFKSGSRGWSPAMRAQTLRYTLLERELNRPERWKNPEPLWQL